MTRVTWFERIMNTVADRGRDLLGLREDAAQDTLPELCARLIGGRGEATNIALAREILRRFDGLDDDQKTAFFVTLAEHFGPDPERIRVAAADFDNERPETLVHLMEVVEPPRQELFRRLNMAPHGTASLVAMRADLLRRLRKQPLLNAVDADFRHLLASWFNRGFLRLQRIDWHSPATVLEKLMRYESVHPIMGWDDLHRRLDEDRRCYGFFHPALPEEPLIFVEVALTRQAADQIAPLIDPKSEVIAPDAADTAMFYSINNALRGLRGPQLVQSLFRDDPSLAFGPDQSFGVHFTQVQANRSLAQILPCGGEVLDQSHRAGRRAQFAERAEDCRTVSFPLTHQMFSTAADRCRPSGTGRSPAPPPDPL